MFNDFIIVHLKRPRFSFCNKSTYGVYFGFIQKALNVLRPKIFHIFHSENFFSKLQYSCYYTQF